MFPIIRAAFALIAFLLACGYALGRGGRDERAASAILTAGMLLTWILISSQAHRYHGPEYGVASADLLTLVGLVWLALATDRSWTLWLAAMQAVVVITHVAAIAKPVSIPHYYKNTVQLWIYPQLLTLTVGTLRHRLRENPSTIERGIASVGIYLATRIFREPKSIGGSTPERD